MKNFEFEYTWNEDGTPKNKYYCIPIKTIKTIFVKSKKERFEVSLKYGVFGNITWILEEWNEKWFSKLIDAARNGGKIVSSNPYGY